MNPLIARLRALERDPYMDAVGQACISDAIVVLQQCNPTHWLPLEGNVDKVPFGVIIELYSAKWRDEVNPSGIREGMCHKWQLPGYHWQSMAWTADHTCWVSYDEPTHFRFRPPPPPEGT